MDYLGLVFRNNSMPATPHLVHMAEAPAELDGPRYVLDRLTDNREVARLRAEHQADIVHLFIGEPRQILRYCGIAWVLLRAGRTERVVEWLQRDHVCLLPGSGGAPIRTSERSSRTRSVTTWAPTTTRRTRGSIRTVP